MSALHLCTVSSLSLCLGIAGCASALGTSRVRGRVTDADGAQPRSYGGAGTVDATLDVRASVLAPDGSLEVLAEGAVRSDGSYDLEVPPGQELLVLQAIDASGEVVAATVLETSGELGETVTASPMNTESSVETAVWIEMAQIAGTNSMDYVDLRSRIDAGVAVALRISALTGNDVSSDVRALAEATLAAQRTEIESYASAGIHVTQRQLFEAELQASKSLSAALEADVTSASAYEEFFSSLADAALSLGIDERAESRAQSSAGVTFRATLHARMNAGPVRDSALVSAAAIEARAHERAIAAVVRAAATTDAALERGTQIIDDLRADLRTSATTDATAEAYTQLAIQIRGNASVSGCLLDSMLELDAAHQASLEAAVTTTTLAIASLDEELEAAIAAWVSAGGSAEALAGSIIAAQAAYEATVERQTAFLVGATSAEEATATVDLLMIANASYRINP